MIAAVKQMEAGRKAEDVGREVGVRTHTIYAWKATYVSEAQEAKRLRDEDSRLRKLVADLSLDKEALQSVIEKTAGDRRDEGRCRACSSQVRLQRAPGLPFIAGSGLELSLQAALRLSSPACAARARRRARQPQARSSHLPRGGSVLAQEGA